MSERSMRRLFALIAKRIGLEYADVVDWLRETNSLAQIEERILQRDFTNAVRGVDDAAKRIASEIQDNYVTAARTEAKWLDNKLPAKLVRFDTTDNVVTARARANQLELVQGFREERYEIARQITQRAMVEGAQAGTNPRRVAQDFRDSIGLTPTQEKHVASYRRALESGDFGNVMRRELHDDRSNRRLRRARKGDALSQAEIDRYVEVYRRNYVAHRAETIARTEALRNANLGVGDAIQQAIQRGDVEAGQLAKTWHARGRKAKGKARLDHRAMDEVSVPVGEDFVLPDGTRMSRPGDPRGGAKHNAGCGCTASTSYVDIPKGFSSQGAPLIEGLPARGDINEDAIYALTPAEIRAKLIALPGGGEDKNRLQSIRDAWDDGVKLAPVNLAMTEGGKLYVEDGRHRLLVALERNQSVLARVARAATGAEVGTVALKHAA